MGTPKYVSLTEQMTTEAERLLAQKAFAPKDRQLVRDWLDGKFNWPKTIAEGGEYWLKIEKVEALLTEVSGWVWNPKMLTPERQKRDFFRTTIFQSMEQHLRKGDPEITMTMIYRGGLYATYTRKRGTPYDGNTGFVIADADGSSARGKAVAEWKERAYQRLLELL